MAVSVNGVVTVVASVGKQLNIFNENTLLSFFTERSIHIIHSVGIDFIIGKCSKLEVF